MAWEKWTKHHRKTLGKVPCITLGKAGSFRFSCRLMEDAHYPTFVTLYYNPKIDGVAFVFGDTKEEGAMKLRYNLSKGASIRSINFSRHIGGRLGSYHVTQNRYGMFELVVENALLRG